MPRDLVPHRTEPKEEVSHTQEKHDRVFDAVLTRDINRADAAEDARARPQAEAHERDFQMAKDRLWKMTYVQTLEFLHAMPTGMLELYLLAEEDTRNRKDVLKFFPKPGGKARSRYLPVTVAATEDAEE